VLKIKILLCLVFPIAVFAQPYQFGKTYLDPEGWNGLMVGNMPLVISVPHGGTINLDDIEDRSRQGSVTVTDSYTKELALEIASIMDKYYGYKPYLVVCNLIRKDIDQNREINEGTCGNGKMEKPWNVFHDFTDSALAMATRQFGACLYIDLHGHGHSVQRLELGYLLKENELKNVIGQTGKTDYLSKKSSFANLMATSKDSLSLSQLMIGENAFGTLMANEGFPSVPSKQDPYPLEGEKYFNGGYNTKRYTGGDYPNVFGWQIESNYKGVRDPSGRSVFAIAFCKVIVKYIKANPFFHWAAMPNSK
jgi:hypothetical protein